MFQEVRNRGTQDFSEDQFNKSFDAFAGGGGDDGTTKRKFSDDGEGVEGSRPPKEPMLSSGEGETSSEQQQ
ncbi:hypothetical protein BX616_003320 [Lobosporangium transversale]|nr:hypothetical protein BX616_003320 [Lobosporangium transversale]